MTDSTQTRKTPAHYCEVCWPAGRPWGLFDVQCLMCGWEATGFEDMDSADAAGDEHVASAGASL